MALRRHSNGWAAGWEGGPEAEQAADKAPPFEQLEYRLLFLDEIIASLSGQ